MKEANKDQHGLAINIIKFQYFNLEFFNCQEIVLYETIIVLGGISFAKKEDSTEFALKIKGVFKNKADAEMHARNLQLTDSRFDLLVVEMYKWLLMPPPVSFIDNQIHIDDRLTNIIKSHNEEQIKANQVFSDRISQTKK